MNIFQIVGIAVTGAVFSVMLKGYKPEFAIFVGIATGMLLIAYAVSARGSVFDMIREIVDMSGVDEKYFSLLLKIIGVAYITEFSSEICRDAGQGAISAKLEMIGKLFIMFLSMPIIKSFLEVCIGAVNLL